MTVHQIFLYDVNSTEGAVPLAAVATDGVTAVTSFGPGFPEQDKESLAQNFTIKAARVKDLDMEVWESPIEVLRYNLMFLTSEAQEHETFEQAQAAAQEAFGE